MYCRQRQDRLAKSIRIHPAEAGRSRHWAISETQKDLTTSFLPAPIVGHAGDGNFHVVYVLNPSDLKEMAEAERLSQRLVNRALSLDGTRTGEHGIGCGKIDFLMSELGEAVRIMRAIKKAIDPDNIMNPGKILRMQTSSPAT